MSRGLPVALSFWLVLELSPTAAAVDALETFDVPASGRLSFQAAAGTVTDYMKSRTGQLKFKDVDDDEEHYCTAQLTSAYDGHGPEPTEATLLVTAAHCVGSNFKEFTFTTELEPVTRVPLCYARNPQWIPPDSGQPYDPFINARVDYAFLSIPSVSIRPFDIKWTGSWDDPNDLILQSGISVVGYPYTTQAITALSLSPIRLDFYYRKLNAASSLDVHFTKGTSGGAWLNSANQIVSLTSSYIGRTHFYGVEIPDVDVPGAETPVDYITLYGPIMHNDAFELAKLAEGSGTESEGPLLDECE